MAKKKEMIMKVDVKEKKVGEKKVGVCSWCNWSKKDWAWVSVSEVALYFFFWYALSVLGAVGNTWVDSLILLVLINVMFFACPVFRKHYA